MNSTGKAVLASRQNRKFNGGRITKAKTDGGRKSSRIANRKEPANVQSAAPLSKRKSPRKKARKNLAKKAVLAPTKANATNAKKTKQTKTKARVAKKTTRVWPNAFEMPDPAAAKRARHVAAPDLRAARAVRELNRVHYNTTARCLLIFLDRLRNTSSKHCICIILCSTRLDTTPLLVKPCAG